ncbi:MAG TPA: hypothetical protein DCS82_06380 [Rhodospirillaceae bacterium]|nr:hypothetical protein [Rhodospirillaceae bacterium]
MKKLLIVLASIVIVIAVAVWLFFANIGDIIVAIVEKVGSDVTKVEVELDSADVETTSGKASLSGLSVGNPGGFKTDSAFELGKIAVTLDTNTLTKDVIVVKEVVIDKPHVTYEFGDKGSNLDQIQKNVQQASGGSQQKASDDKDDPNAKKVIIENLYIRGGKIDISGGLLGEKKLGTGLPTIHLKDIGKEGGKSKGASPAEVAKKVIDAITGHASKAVVNLSDVKKLIGGQLGKIGSGASGAAKAVKEKAGGLLDKGKGLFGK